MKIFLACIIGLLIALGMRTSHSPAPYSTAYDSLFTLKPDYIADKFDFPVGKPNAKGYYNAQGFKKNRHLGDDWNGNGGGNTDLGDPIYSIANGYIKQAMYEGSGWGNVIRIIHKLPDGTYVESLYAHCDEMNVKAKQWVKRGEQIATIGNANGAYYAHLHLELRTTIDMELGGGYSTDTTGFVNPTWFINKHWRIAVSFLAISMIIISHSPWGAAETTELPT